MTLMLSQCVPFALSMFLLAIPAHAQSGGLHGPTGSSGECGGEPAHQSAAYRRRNFTPSLRSRGVRSATEQKQALKVLALGPPSPNTRGGGTGLAPYPVGLEHELEKVLAGVDVTVQGRTLPGDITAQAVGTIMNIASETEPELIVWQVGIDDALAQAEIAPFAEALDEEFWRGFAPMRSTLCRWSLRTQKRWRRTLISLT